MDFLFLSTKALPGYLAQAIEQQGYHPHWLADLDQAISVAENRYFGAALIDVEQSEAQDLPDICAYLKTAPIFQEMPLIVATPPYSTMRAAILEAGAQDLLTAPLELNELLLRLRHAKHYHEVASYAGWHGMADILLHDLKGPTALIISTLELLNEMMGTDTNPTAAAYRTFVQNCLNAAHRSNFMVTDMVDYILLQQNDLKIAPAWIKLSSLITVVREQTDASLENKGLTVAYQIPEDLPAIYVDAELTERALIAMIDTILKFCIRDDTLCVQAKAVQDKVVLTFTDTGRTILPQYAKALFTPLQQTQARHEGSRSSVAMSLPFAYSALRAMGGDLSAQSVDKHTTFTLTFPTHP